MSQHDEESFYKYAMEIFFMTGHISTFEPEFSNHSPEQFVYFDSKSEVSLSRDQRAMFKLFNNISRLFSVNGCIFFSINLLTVKKYRSQVAYDIHTMIHPISGAGGTICLFHHNDELILSFVGYGNHCILSDWYPMDDECGMLFNRLDIANMSIQSGVEYFSDMVYILARGYYFAACESTVYDILPIDFIYGMLDREDLDQIAKDVLSASEREYGDDYIKYDESVGRHEVDISADLDLMLLEMDSDDSNLFDGDIEASEYEDDELSNGDGYIAESEQDMYEFDNVDPEIFRDPTLMVKWLKKQENLF